MKPLIHYFQNQIIIPIDKDLEKSKRLIKDSKKRIKFYSLIEINDKNAKFVFENYYKALREKIDARLYSKGLKSYSHEASIASLQENKIEQRTIQKIDRMRKLRNKSKYEGKEISLEIAKDFIKFTNRIIQKI